MISNYKMILAYDGSRYYGWEHQPDRETIQGKIEKVLERMCGGEPEKSKAESGADGMDGAAGDGASQRRTPEPPGKVIGAGRTDAGVHARAMVCNVFLDTELSPEEIRSYMNRYLPDDIAVREVRIASDRFHARYNATGKTYRYTCYIGDAKPVFDRKYVMVLDYLPDIPAMRRAAEYLVGSHDFKSFCGNGRMKKSTVRLVDSLEISVKKEYLSFTIHGTGFLQNMVRIIVGTLLEVGRGAYPPEYVKEILDAKDRRAAGPTAPAEGLTLLKVDYD